MAAVSLLIVPHFPTDFAYNLQDANDEYYLATSQEVDGLSGQYFVSSQKLRLAQPAQDSGQRKRLWDILEKQSGHHPEM